MSAYDDIITDIGSVDIEWWNKRSQPQIGTYQVVIIRTDLSNCYHHA